MRKVTSVENLVPGDMVLSNEMHWLLLAIRTMSSHTPIGFKGMVMVSWLCSETMQLNLECMYPTQTTHEWEVVS